MEDVQRLLEEVVEYLSQPFPSDQAPSPHARLVLFALAAYKARSDQPPGFPPLDHLERVTHLSRPTIRRHMKQWEARGVLTTWHAHWGHERFDEYLLFPSAFRIRQVCGAIPDALVWQTTLRDSPHDMRCGSCRGDLGLDDLGQVQIALPFQDRSYRVFAYLHASCWPTPGKPAWGVVWRLEDFLQSPGYALDEMADLCAYVREKWLPAGFPPTPARPPTPKAGEHGKEERHMDDPTFAAHDALLQRFQDLATQVRQTHMAWREAVRVANFPLQSVLIAREREMLTQAREVLAALQASIAQRHW